MFINQKTSMKKIFVVLVTMLMFYCVFSFSVSAVNDDVSVMLNGDILEFDVQPQIINGRTLVPMRKIFESLGATVGWEDSTQTITAKRNETTVVMQIDNNVMSVNGNPVTLDVPPQLVDSRTLVPVRAVAESFDIDVIWDDVTWTVMLSTYVQFGSTAHTFDYLCSWLLENGKTFGEYIYIGWKLDDGIYLDVRHYPGSGNIAFVLNSYNADGTNTHINLRKTYDGTDVYATYISGSNTCRINGDINIKMHTNNFPLAYRECDAGEYETTYNLLENTRQRINYLLDETAIILSAYNTQVTLKTLGFEKY